VQECVETSKAVLGDEAVAVDPGGQSLEGGRLEVHRTALGVPRTGDQAGEFEDLDVFGDGLLGDGKGLGELVDGRVAAGEAGDNGAANWIGQRQEGAVEQVGVRRIGQPFD
jgi:hypothetical protein